MFRLSILARYGRILAADRRGAAMVEYALLAGLIAVVAIGTLTTVGTGVKAQFSAISNKL